MIEHVVRRSETRFGSGAVVGLGLFGGTPVSPERPIQSLPDRVVATDPVALADQVGRNVRQAALVTAVA
jgi:hypothetical protein